MNKRLSISGIKIDDGSLHWGEESRLLSDIMAAHARPTRGVAMLATIVYMSMIPIGAAVLIMMEQSAGSVALYVGVFAAMVVVSFGAHSWARSPRRPGDVDLVVSNKRSALLPFVTLGAAMDAADRIMSAVAQTKSAAQSADAANPAD